MIINLDPVFSTEGFFQEYRYNLDLSAEQINGSYPIVTPAAVICTLSNNVGIVKLNAEVSLELDVECDRCAKQIKYPFTAGAEHILVRALNDEDNDSFILTESSQLDLDEVLREDILLQLPVKFLCSDDCKGLCARCGKDLNEGPCDCKKEVDPRLEALKQLLDNQ